MRRLKVGSFVALLMAVSLVASGQTLPLGYLCINTAGALTTCPAPAAGPQGDSGIQGIQSIPGLQVIQGIQGIPGPQDPAGPPAPSGRTTPPSPPPTGCTTSITSFGAVGDGKTNNATAIQNAFNSAATNKCTAMIPAGTFAYSGNITVNGIAVQGLSGATSILKPTNSANAAVILTGSGPSISNLTILGVGTSRLTSYQSADIWINKASNFTVQNVLVNGGACVGIFDAGGQNGVIKNNTVENTLADSVTNTNGAANITVSGNRVVNSGDDGISNNSYANDGNTVNHIMITGNTVIGNKGGRGLEVSGGNDIAFTGNYVDNTDGYSDMYVASEREFTTQAVSAITVSGNSFIDGGPNQGSAIVYNSRGTASTVTGVTISGNQFVNPKLGAVQFTGNGVASGTVLNNTAFTSLPFSSSENSLATFTLTNNVVKAPSTFATPLVTPGGGVNF
jgi:hypothetical protein